MLSQMLDNIEGADIFIVLSLLIFLGLFIAAAAYVYKADKQHISNMSEMPLNENPKTISK